MKKYFFVIVLVMLFVTNVMAQADAVAPAKKIVVGITAGPSIDWFFQKNDHYEKGGIIIGVRYGIPLDVNLTDAENYYFSTGLKVEHSGGKIKYKGVYDKFPEENASFTTAYNSIFFSIPTGIKLKTPSFNNFVIAGNFGLSHALALHNTKKNHVDVGKVEVIDKKWSKYENCSFFKESVFVGIGLEYIIRDNCRASFMANYSYSFTNYHNRKAVNQFETKEKLKGNLNAIDFVFGIFF